MIVQKHSLTWADEFEDRNIQVRWCCAHGDLHGHNVLVATDGSACLIDYGDVMDAPASLDPVTLELSLFSILTARFEMHNGRPRMTQVLGET